MLARNTLFFRLSFLSLLTSFVLFAAHVNAEAHSNLNIAAKHRMVKRTPSLQNLAASPDASDDPLLPIVPVGVGQDPSNPTASIVSSTSSASVSAATTTGSAKSTQSAGSSASTVSTQSSSSSISSSSSSSSSSTNSASAASSTGSQSSTASSSTQSSSSSSSSTTSSAVTTAPPSATPSNSDNSNDDNSNNEENLTTSTFTAPAQTSSANANAAAAPSSDTSSDTKTTITIVVVIASCVGGAFLIWTIIRKWKFRPSTEFENRMNAIDWQPSASDGGHDDGFPGALRRNASNASHGSFYTESAHDQPVMSEHSNMAGRVGAGYGTYATNPNSLVADLPSHDFTATGPTNLAPGGGYADLAREDSFQRQPSVNRGGYNYGMEYSGHNGV